MPNLKKILFNIILTGAMISALDISVSYRRNLPAILPRPALYSDNPLYNINTQYSRGTRVIANSRPKFLDIKTQPRFKQDALPEIKYRIVVNNAGRSSIFNRFKPEIIGQIDSEGIIHAPFGHRYVLEHLTYSYRYVEQKN